MWRVLLAVFLVLAWTPSLPAATVADSAVFNVIKRALGLFLQEKTRPDRVYSVALAPGFLDCEVRIERATSTDTVVSCTGEKAYQAANQKLNSCTTLEPRPW